MTEKNPLDELLGEEVSAVSFVMDYVEIHFHGRILRCIAHPLIRRGAREIRFPAGGSRDALCELIGSRVARAVAGAAAIEVDFSSGDRLVIPLGPNDQRGGEWAHFLSGENKPLAVW